jgi:hypothetical protein
MIYVKKDYAQRLKEGASWLRQPKVGKCASVLTQEGNVNDFVHTIELHVNIIQG